MRFAKWTIVCLIGCGALAAYGDNPPRKPDRPDRPERGPARPTPGQPPAEVDWPKFHAELEKFCQQNSPRRWETIKKSRSEKNTGAKLEAWRVMAQRFRGLQMLERDDKELYNVKLRQIQIEDVEFGLLQDMKRNPNEDLKAKLRDNAQQYVSARFEERKIRIARLEKLLELQKQQLESDKSSTDRLVGERVELLVKEGPEFFMPRHQRRGEDGAPSTHPANPGADINAAP